MQFVTSSNIFSKKLNKLINFIIYNNLNEKLKKLKNNIINTLLFIFLPIQLES